MYTSKSRRAQMIFWLSAMACATILGGCIPHELIIPTSQNPSNGLVLYDWSDDLPASVITQFEQQYSIDVQVITFESMEEGVLNIRNGLSYDVAVVESDFVPGLVEQGLLMEMDKHLIPNFTYISPHFRDLLFDPDNRFSVPYGWGGTGLLVKTEYSPLSVDEWADLWSPELAGRIVVREQPVELISVALLALGYPLNSEDPAHLAAAGESLRQLKGSVIVAETESVGAVSDFISSDAVVMIAWGEDAMQAAELDPSISFIIPLEGAMIWSDNYVISASSQHHENAHRFINFLLEPEISAQIANEKYFAVANEGAYRYILPEVLNNPAVFITETDLARSNWYMPLSAQGEAAYTQVWEEFVKGTD